MEKLIAIDELIKKAKKQGITFGAGNPYNRLRYYTKIGWLPHMIRKKVGKGATEGHYPSWALDRLQLIHDLKEQGYSNDEITKRLGMKDRLRGLSSFIQTPEARTKVITYTSFLILLLIFASEIGALPIGRAKSDLLIRSSGNLPATILDAGTSFIRANNNIAFVRSQRITPNSKVYVTFNQNYSPAARFWVSEKEASRGFFIELDAPTSSNAEFSWWITD
jgi:DNA-binding transcriptional MerR regulator